MHCVGAYKFLHEVETNAKERRWKTWLHLRLPPFTKGYPAMTSCKARAIPYAEQHHPSDARHHTYQNPYLWSNVAVRYILDRQEHLGHTVLGKSICENFKTKQRRKALPHELIIIPDTHEAIISQSLWDKAQRQRIRQPKTTPNGTFTHRLSGLVCEA